MNFCLNMCDLMGKSVAIFQKFSFNPLCFLVKMQKKAFLKKNGFTALAGNKLQKAPNT